MVVNEIIQSAKDEILKGGMILPTFFIISDNNVSVVDDEDFGDDQTFDTIKDIIKRNKAHIVLYVTETYFTKDKDAILLTDYFQKDCKRGLMFTTITPNKEFTRIFPFHQASRGIKFDAPEINISDEITGYGDYIFEHTIH